MGPIEIIVIVVTIVISLLILGYLLKKKLKGQSISCDCKKCSGKDLVKEYHQKYKKIECSCNKKES